MKEHFNTNLLIQLLFLVNIHLIIFPKQTLAVSYAI